MLTPRSALPRRTRRSTAVPRDPRADRPPVGRPQANPGRQRARRRHVLDRRRARPPGRVRAQPAGRATREGQGAGRVAHRDRPRSPRRRSTRAPAADRLGHVLGPVGPEVSCERCCELLDAYVGVELCGGDADAAMPGMRAHLEGVGRRLPRIRALPRCPQIGRPPPGHGRTAAPPGRGDGRCRRRPDRCRWRVGQDRPSGHDARGVRRRPSTVRRALDARATTAAGRVAQVLRRHDHRAAPTSASRRDARRRGAAASMRGRTSCACTTWPRSSRTWTSAPRSPRPERRTSRAHGPIRRSSGCPRDREVTREPKASLEDAG